MATTCGTMRPSGAHIKTMSRSTVASSLGIDEETRLLILKKTWCHGQLVLPVFAILYLYLFVALPQRHLIFLWAAVILPLWSYVSYHHVLSSPVLLTTITPTTLFWGLAVCVEMAHLGVFWTVWGIAQEAQGQSGMNVLMLIASGLFFIETLAFLLVVRTLGGAPASDGGMNTVENYQYQATSATRLV